VLTSRRTNHFKLKKDVFTKKLHERPERSKSNIRVIFYVLCLPNRPENFIENRANKMKSKDISLQNE